MGIGETAEEEEMQKVLSPVKSIRKFCMWCGKDSFEEIKLCSIDDCPIWVYRLGRRPKAKSTPVKSIKAKCLDCSGFEREEARNCTFTDCALYPYRKGKAPNRKPVANNGRHTLLSVKTLL